PAGDREHPRAHRARPRRLLNRVRFVPGVSAGERVPEATTPARLRRLGESRGDPKPADAADDAESRPDVRGEVAEAARAGLDQPRPRQGEHQGRSGFVVRAGAARPGRAAEGYGMALRRGAELAWRVATRSGHAD